MVIYFLRLYKTYRRAQRRKQYTAYLQSPAWRKIRQKALDRAGGRCEYRQDGYRCKATKRLHGHHLTYKRFGHENVEDLMMLCAFHHRMVHSKRGTKLTA